MLQACLNGGRTKQFHRAVPMSPSELAADALAAVSAGAQELHIHPRGADGLESLDPDDTAQALGAIREVCPGIPVGLSTGWWIKPGGHKRHECIRNWSVLPDYVSVNLMEEDAPDIIALALERGIGVEAGLWSVEDTERFLSLPQARSCLRVLIEINEQNDEEGLTVARAILTRLDRGGFSLPRLLHGSDATMWPIYREALRLELDGRIGLEDGSCLPSGETATDNAALIEAAHGLARSWTRAGKT